MGPKPMKPSSRNAARKSSPRSSTLPMESSGCLVKRSHQTAVQYHRMSFDFTGEFGSGEFEMTPVLEDGWAAVLEPAPDMIIQGTLVDSPEAPDGVACVVLDTAMGTKAFVSRTLGNVVIENAPCVLEFRSVQRNLSPGGEVWDWEVHEISPNGCRILVSE